MPKLNIYPNSKKLTSIDYLSSSQECNYIEYLTSLDTSYSLREKHLITEINLIEKLFLQHDNNNSEIDFKKTFFLKNKYLYLYGEGAMYYLHARSSMYEDKKKLDELEVDNLINFLNEIYKDKFEEVSLISLGSANAAKEINAIYGYLKPISSKKTFQLIPIDVSAPLIQLAVLEFHEIFNKTNHDVSIRPIIGDIWNIADSDEEFLFKKINNNVPKIFTLLGSTIGNYREKELLIKILKMMDEKDYLILGFNLNPHSNPKESKKIVFNQYNKIGNIQFMLNPLNYIPKYRGYASSFDKYFKLDMESSIIQATVKQENEYKLLTDINGSTCYAPKLTIPIGDNKTITISLAQSTKYDYDSFSKFIDNVYLEESNHAGSINHYFEIQSEFTKVGIHDCYMTLKKISKTISQAVLTDGTQS